MARVLKNLKEVRLIEKFSKQLMTSDASVIVAIGDDAAVVRGNKGHYWLYTADMLVESVHFKKNESYEKIGRKVMAVSVSDIAAMGGVPKYALISVGLPQKNVSRAAALLFQGINMIAKKFSVSVIGGDTNRSDRLVIDCFMVGEVETKKLTLRSTARPGDHIFVSGPLGGSITGKHLMFEPRLKESQFLTKNFKVTSMIDLSDGLGVDLNRIAEASRVGALIFEHKIPRSTKAARIKNILFDGEDFELLFTLSSRDAMALLSLMKKNKTDFKFTPIGRMTDLFDGVRMMTTKGTMTDVGVDGFQHF